MTTTLHSPSATPPARTTGPATAATLRERAIAIAPRIAERAADQERDREVSPESIRDLIDAGLVRALQPRRWGGEEADPADFAGAVIEIAKACTSTGWLLMLLGVHSWELAHMSDQAQAHVWSADPDTLISSSYAPHGTAERVDGGYLLRGQWKSSSGVTHARHVILGAQLPDHPNRGMGNFLVDLAECEIVDDWFVLGMRATASRSVRADGVFVPEHRVLDRDVLLAQLGPGLRENRAPLYRVPQGLIYNVVAGAPALGAAWAFYTEFIAQLKRVVRRFDGVAMRSEPVQLLRLTEARVALEDQEATVLRVLGEAYAVAATGERQQEIDVARGIYDLARTAQAALGVAQELFPALSSAAVLETNPLQRIYRDLLTARQHFTQNTDFAAAMAANLELGNEAVSPFLLTTDRLALARTRAAQLYG